MRLHHDIGSTTSGSSASRISEATRSISARSSDAQIALAWLLAQRPWIVPIQGRRSWSVWKRTSKPRSDSRRHRVEIGRGPVRVARAGEGRSHDRCPRRARNRWHHRLDRSCACGPVFREALNHVSRLGPERPGSPRSFLNLPRSTKVRLARRAGPSGSCVGRSVTRPSTGPTPGRHRCRPRRPHASHPPFDLSGRTEAARSPAW
jgi:hypothetical protein